ncbi:MAG: universal stress protein [Blastocatellales bacterium]
MKILLAVDGSESSMAAVDEAARTPWPEGSKVRIVTVAEIPLPTMPWTMPVPGGTYEEFERMFEERSMESATKAAARFGEIAGSKIDVITKTLKGDPKKAILDDAEHWGADLIVVGTHGYNALQRFWLGSVSRAVVSNAKCSVQVVRRREGQSVGEKGMRILIAVDGSAPSGAAVEEIASRPWSAGSEVRVISAVHLPFTPTPETWALPESYYSTVGKIAREQADLAVNSAITRLLESNTAREIPMTLSEEVIVGHAEEVIIEDAKKWGADLIAVGSHGYSGFERFLLGSVSQAVASHAPCSVEIVREKSFA